MSQQLLMISIPVMKIIDIKAKLYLSGANELIVVLLIKNYN